MKFKKSSGVGVLLVGAALAIGASSAQAIVLAASDTTPVVVDTVTQTSRDTWSYGLSLASGAKTYSSNPYFAENGPYLLERALTDFYIPFFADSGIRDVTAPVGWTWAIEEENVFAAGFAYTGDDIFNLSGDVWALHWSTSDAVAYGIKGCKEVYSNVDGSSSCSAMPLAGFGYVADYGPVKAPFKATNAAGSDYYGDPALPGSPLALAAGLTTPFQVSAVPEPSTYALIFAGLVAMGLVRKRRGDA